jgi:hypothetical protein
VAKRPSPAYRDQLWPQRISRSGAAVLTVTTLPRFTLKHNKLNDRWDLKNQIGDTVKSFSNKIDATAGGVLAVKRGTVRIHTTDGRIQEERTYPRSADPRRAPG